MIGGWNVFNVSLGPKVFILKSVGGQIILNSHGLLNDEEAIDWSEGFSNLPLDKGNKFKEGSWEAYQGGGWCVFFFNPRKRKRRRSV